MTNTKEFFLTATQRIFSNWTALKLAVEHGMGPKESAVEFCPYMTDVLYMNERLDSNQIAAELEDYMDEQFNTELQDGSAIQVAEELLRFYRYCIEGNESTAIAELEKLPSLQPWLISTQPSQSNSNSVPINSDSSSEEDINMHEADGEWTKVTNRRRR